MKWSPHPKQAMALKCPAFEVFFGGARGGGKTDWLLAEFVKNINYGVKHKGILFRKSYPELEEVIRRAKVMFAGMATWAEGKKTFTFEGGATLKMRFVENFNDTLHYHGHAYTFIGFDELTSWPNESVYVTLFACARSSEGAPVTIRATGNPGTVGHPWVQERFIDVCEPFEIYTDIESQLTRCFIPSTLDDNPSLLINDPSYERRLKMVGGKRYRAWRYGDWTRVEGAALDAFDPNFHVVSPYTIDPGWKRVIGFDWGFSTPFSVGWYAIKPDGVLVRYKEFYGSFGKKNEGLRWGAKKVAEELAERSRGDPAKLMFADPSCWQTRGTGADEGESVIQWFQFYHEGPRLSCRKANNDRTNGYLACYGLLNARNNEGGPMFEVFNTNKHFIRTIGKLVHDPHNPDDIDTRMEDHCLVGDTEVYTEKGKRNIRDLVGTEGVILTVNGAFTPYHSVRCTKENAEVMTVVFDDGREVTCTPDHKFLTREGWIEAQQLLHQSVEGSSSKPVVVKIIPSGNEDVYCLVAEKTHSFAVAGGIIVHNCYDEWRYVVMAMRYLRSAVGVTRRRRKKEYDVLRA